MDVPPVTLVTEAVPFAVPQLALLVINVAFVGPAVVPITNVVLYKQPLLSLTLIVCVPAIKPFVKLEVATASTLNE